MEWKLYGNEHHIIIVVMYRITQHGTTDFSVTVYAWTYLPWEINLFQTFTGAGQAGVFASVRKTNSTRFAIVHKIGKLWVSCIFGLSQSMTWREQHAITVCQTFPYPGMCHILLIKSPRRYSLNWIIDISIQYYESIAINPPCPCQINNNRWLLYCLVLQTKMKRNNDSPSAHYRFGAK